MVLGFGPRRVVAIDGRLLAYRRGGIPRYVRGLLDHLPGAAEDLRFSLVVNRRAALPRVSTIAVRTPPHYRFERLALGAELSLRRPALFHATDFVPPHTAGVARVATVHDLAFLDHPEHLSADASRYYGQLPRAIADADHVIAVSDATRRRVVEHLGVPPDRVTTVYHGVDHEFFEPCPRDDATLEAELPPEVAAQVLAERPVILAVGTVEPRKRLALLAGVVEALASARPDASPLLVVVGERGWRSGDTEATVAALAHRGLAVRLPEVGDAALRALYRVATILAVPSLDEGFGLPVAEAMASGLPVVASARGAIPEVVADAGILLSEDDTGSWTDAIGSLLDDASRRADLAARGRARAQRFRWETTAAATVAVYRRVLEA